MTITEEPGPGEAAPDEKPLPVIPQDMPIAKLIGHYVKYRDAIKAKEAEQKEALKPAKQMLEALGNRMLDILTREGSDSIKSEQGTVYRTQRDTASISDPEMFKAFVIANEGFDMLDWKANTTAVKDYIGEYDEPPPGVKLSSIFTVGVRRGTDK